MDDVADAVKVADKAGEVYEAGKALTKVDDTADILKTLNPENTGNIVSEHLDVSSFPMKIHSGRYGKHIVGNNNYTVGRSIVELSESETLDLLKRLAGTGQKLNSNSERIDFGVKIGKYVNLDTGKAYDTTVAKVRYSKDGIHIVPAKPNNWKGD